MHTQNQEKNKPHKRTAVFLDRVFLRRGLLVLQLPKAAQSLGTSPD